MGTGELILNQIIFSAVPLFSFFLSNEYRVTDAQSDFSFC